MILKLLKTFKKLVKSKFIIDCRNFTTQSKKV